jgi:transposase
LFTRNGRGLTARGVKPICPFQQKFENFYLFGAFSPINGSSFLLELPYCNTDMFQLFVNEFSKHKKKELKVMLLDNGAFHKAKKLIIPSNIILLFLPPYSPELNPAEKVWDMIKDELVLKSFETLDKLKNKLTQIIKKTIHLKSIKSLCGFQYLQCKL